jgi:hypothetical protein
MSVKTMSASSRSGTEGRTTKLLVLSRAEGEGTLKALEFAGEMKHIEPNVHAESLASLGISETN